MAVYYKWIKGCAAGSTLTSGLWTYLKWGGNANSANNADGSAGKTTNNLPHIYTYIGKKDNPETENDLGYILTNAATDVSIESHWKFNNSCGLSFNENDTTERAKFYSDNTGFYLSTKNWTISDSSNSNALMMRFYEENTKKIEIGGNNYPTYILGTLNVSSTTILKGTVSITDTTATTSATSGALIVTGGIGVGGAIYSGSSCTAVFFNATSDKRAKENIRPANYSALDLIKKLPVYIYNYKNSNETVTGILAQDLLEAQPKELNLVSNINATGENNDYMSIKHDKLMFVLMKAIQEQQEQIEQLKSEIAKIKKTN